MMNTNRQRIYLVSSRVMAMIFLFSFFALPLMAFIPKDTLGLKKEIQKFAQKDAKVSNIVNFINTRKKFSPPAALPISSFNTASNETDRVENVRATRLSDSKFAMVYQAGTGSPEVRAMVGEVQASGVINFGFPATVATLNGNKSGNVDITALDDSHVIVVADTDNGSSSQAIYAVGGMVSGNSIFMDAVAAQNYIPGLTPTTSHPYGEVRVAALTATKFLVAYTQDNGAGLQFGRAIVGTYDSNMFTVNYNSTYSDFSDAQTNHISLTAFSSSKAVVAYNEGGNTIKAKVLDINTTSDAVNVGGAYSAIVGTPTIRTAVSVINSNQFLFAYEVGTTSTTINLIKCSVTASTITQVTNISGGLHTGIFTNSLTISKVADNEAIVNVLEGGQAHVYRIDAASDVTDPSVTHNVSFSAQTSGADLRAFTVGLSTFRMASLIVNDVGASGGYVHDQSPAQVMKVLYNGVVINDVESVVDINKGTLFDTIQIGGGGPGPGPGGPSVRTFTIRNDGTGTMNLTGNPVVDFTTAGSPFSITTQASPITLSPGQEATFDVQFNPTTAGEFINNITIAADDPNLGADNAYTFQIKGVGTAAPAFLQLFGNNNEIFSDFSQFPPSTNDNTDFGTTAIGDSVDVQFEIRNTGATAMNVSSVTTNNAKFTIATNTAGGVTVNAGQNVTFTVRYKPTTAALETATITINSDAINNPFTFNVQATGIVALLPTAFTQRTVGKNEVTLDWIDNNTTEVGYTIYRFTVPQGPATLPPISSFTRVVTTQPNTTSYTDNGLQSNTTYLYRIIAEAQNSGENSAPSDTARITTLPNSPTAPSSLNALTLSQSEIQLEWRDNSINESGFEVYRRKVNDPASTFALITTLSSNSEFYIDQGLESKTAYAYILLATGTEGNSLPTDTATATTLSNAPASPSDLLVETISGTELQLDWVDNSGNELGFVIYRSVEQFGTYSVIDTVPTNMTVYQDTALTVGTTYYYYVEAFNGDGASIDRSNIASGIPQNVPLIPSNIQITSLSPTSVEITWTVDNPPSTERTANGFKVEVASLLGTQGIGQSQRRSWPPETFTNGRKVARTTNDGFSNLIFTEIGSVDAATTKFTATGLIANQKYLFRLRSFNDNGNSPYTPDQTIVTNVDTSVPVPNSPTNLKVTSVSQSELDLTWQDNSSDELVFKIERKLNSQSDADWLEIAQVIGGTTSFSSTDLLADSTYEYRVRASNQGGDSPYSNISSAKVECNLVVLVTNNSGTNTICSGKAALLVVNTNVSDATYQWKLNGINIANANLPIYNATETGEYNCQVIAGNCSKSSSTPSVVIVQSSFQASITLTDSLNNILRASVSGAQGYQWYKDYQPITGATESSYQAVTDGAYFVVVSNEGCASTSNLINLASITITGLEDNEFSQGISISPNPSATQSVLKMNNEEFGPYKILITDNQGKVLERLKGEKTSKKLEVDLPIQRLSEGLYLVKIQMKKKEGVKKLLKK
ncbi:hypothetical protein BKI52_13965 [marine bacterium AO1-C]|nr:hypothetical protein BKI52_13965 [marine bacterium AO1-C]